MSNKSFTGPLFLVGMPRSGTKLLRTLLNANPSVAIPQAETHFIPHWHTHWASFGDLANPEVFGRFYESCLRLPYFHYTAERQAIISCESWHRRCQRFDLAEVFEVLMRHDAGIGEDATCIWGDKTPSYLGHMPLLKALFPMARFVHIVRDVRDYCLSSRQAWGKSMLRAAQSWADGVAAATRFGECLGEDYMQMRYEDLLEDAEQQLRAVCRFLGIAFTPSMLTPNTVVENLGDTKGIRNIVSSNTSKYLDQMDAGKRKKIESITADQLRALGYPVDHSGPQKRLSGAMLKSLQVVDGFNLVRFEIANRNFFEAIKLRWGLFTTSGNRY